MFKMNKKVAIIGKGWVGTAMLELFPDALVYMRDLSKAPLVTELDRITYTSSKEFINQADIAFICVPTPNLIEHKLVKDPNIPGNGLMIPSNEGKLDTSIVEECIAWCECPLLVIRSTVNPGDCDKWMEKFPNKTILFQPEYLGETPQHPLLDTKETPFIIIGTDDKLMEGRLLVDLYTTVYNANVKIRFVTLLEAEIIKLSENRAIAFKVAQCQELYDVCLRTGVDYYTIRDAVYGDDPRFNLWWTFVYPDKRGFKSKCIPKDIYAWCAWAESLGYEPKITRAILEKNKEWIGA